MKLYEAKSILKKHLKPCPLCGSSYVELDLPVCFDDNNRTSPVGRFTCSNPECSARFFIHLPLPKGTQWEKLTFMEKNRLWDELKAYKYCFKFWNKRETTGSEEQDEAEIDREICELLGDDEDNSEE